MTLRGYGILFFVGLVFLHGSACLGICRTVMNSKILKIPIQLEIYSADWCSLVEFYIENRTKIGLASISPT